MLRNGEPFVARSNLIKFVKLPLPCPHCGKESTETVARIIRHEELPCSRCGQTIELRSDEWQAFVAEIANAMTKLRAAYRRLP